MTQPAIRAVVFDIGNVLVIWDPYPAFEQALGSRAAVDAFFDRIEFHERNLRADAGARFADLADELEDEADRALLASHPSRFGLTVAETIEGTWALMDRLRAAGLEIHAITNWSAENWDTGIAAQPRLGAAFGTAVVSGEVGMAKPDPAIFRLFCARTGLEPTECLFIDDKEENVAAARAIGMDGVRFTTPEALEPELEARGLI